MKDLSSGKAAYKLILFLAVLLTAALATIYYTPSDKPTETEIPLAVFAGERATHLFTAPPYISPKILKAMMPSLSGDFPGMTRIDLNVAIASQKYKCDIEVKETQDGHSLVVCSEENSWLAYYCVGMSDSGIIPLYFADNGGGSGTFCSVLLVRLEVEDDHMTIERVDKISLGDRWLGSLRVEKNELLIETDLTRSHTRFGPEDGDGKGRVRLD